MDRSLVCIISGNKYTFVQNYFEKKIEEYGDIETLKKYFVTKKVKSLILRGYGVNEIRNILSIVDSELLPSDDKRVQDVILYHSQKNDTVTRRTNSIFTNLKSDPEVSEYIKKIKAAKHSS